MKLKKCKSMPCSEGLVCTGGGEGPGSGWLRVLGRQRGREETLGGWGMSGRGEKRFWRGRSRNDGKVGAGEGRELPLSQTGFPLPRVHTHFCMAEFTAPFSCGAATGPDPPACPACARIPSLAGQGGVRCIPAAGHVLVPTTLCLLPPLSAGFPLRRIKLFSYISITLCNSWHFLESWGQGREKSNKIFPAIS